MLLCADEDKTHWRMSLKVTSGHFRKSQDHTGVLKFQENVFQICKAYQLPYRPGIFHNTLCT